MSQPENAFAAAVASVRRGERELDAAVADLVGQLPDPELLWLLDGDLTILRGLRDMSKGYNKLPFPAGRLDRHGLPGIMFTDGPRGAAVGASTAFPVAIARAAVLTTLAATGWATAFRTWATWCGTALAITTVVKTRIAALLLATTTFPAAIALTFKSGCALRAIAA